MDNGPQAGFECYAYYNSGTHASPTWVLMRLIRDLNSPESFTEIDASARQSARKKTLVGMADNSLEFDYLYIKGSNDPVFAALQTKKNARTPIQIAIADGPIATSGTTYEKDWYQFTKFDRGEPLDDAVKYDIALKPTIYFDSGTLIDRSYHTVS